MSYVDGFIMPVPKKKIAEYRRLARLAARVWTDHGALAYVEALADDLKVGKRTSFPRSVQLKPDETVVLAYIVYRSRRDRDRINARAMQDPRLANYMDPKTLPFDTRRMVWGGFKTLVER